MLHEMKESKIALQLLDKAIILNPYNSKFFFDKGIVHELT